METWLSCTLFPGQFSSELAVVVRSLHGRSFSLFAQKTDLKYSIEPRENCSVDGWIRVEILGKEKGAILVRLPQTTLENGPYLTVSEDQLKKTPGRQKV